MVKILPPEIFMSMSDVGMVQAQEKAGRNIHLPHKSFSGFHSAQSLWSLPLIISIQ